jgi:hypothetical protein
LSGKENCVPIDDQSEPPAPSEPPGKPSNAPIADMRNAFPREKLQPEEERARTRSFIDGKIEMIRSDPNMTETEKEAAIANLEAQR